MSLRNHTIPAFSLWSLSLKLLYSPTRCRSVLLVILPFIYAWKSAFPLIFLTQSTIGGVLLVFAIWSFSDSAFTNPTFLIRCSTIFFLENYCPPPKFKYLCVYTAHLRNISSNVFLLANSVLNSSQRAELHFNRKRQKLCDWLCSVGSRQFLLGYSYGNSNSTFSGLLESNRKLHCVVG